MATKHSTSKHWFVDMIRCAFIAVAACCIIEGSEKEKEISISLTLGDGFVMYDFFLSLFYFLFLFFHHRWLRVSNSMALGIVIDEYIYVREKIKGSFSFPQDQ